VRIRRSTGPGASPLPGQNENRNEQTRLRQIRALVAGQSLCERSAGTRPLIFVVSITLVTSWGDR
jgi:hypothetical protein